jgi:hypothetical protein
MVTPEHDHLEPSLQILDDTELITVVKCTVN